MLRIARHAKQGTPSALLRMSYDTRKVKQYLENSKRVSLHDRVLAYFGAYLLRPPMNLLTPQGSPTYIGIYRITAVATGFTVLFRTVVFCGFILRECTPSCGRPASMSGRLIK